MTAIGANMPWSKPRWASSPDAMPAAASASRTRAATAGAPGAGYWMRYVKSGKPP